MLLYKQDKLSQLEERLNHIDCNEQKVLFLGNYRRDSNMARKQVLEEIDTALADYGGLGLDLLSFMIVFNKVHAEEKCYRFIGRPK